MCHGRSKYKPIKFGDGPDPDTVEGHRNRMTEAAETRRYDKRMKELAAEDEARRVGSLSRSAWILHFEIGEILTCCSKCHPSKRSLSPVCPIGVALWEE